MVTARRFEEVKTKRLSISWSQSQEFFILLTWTLIIILVINLRSKIRSENVLYSPKEDFSWLKRIGYSRVQEKLIFVQSLAGSTKGYGGGISGKDGERKIVHPRRRMKERKRNEAKSAR